MTDRIRTERAQGQPLAMAEVSPRRDWIALRRGALVTFGLGLMASLSWPPSCSALNLEDRSAPIETAAGKLATATERVGLSEGLGARSQSSMRGTSEVGWFGLASRL